MCDIKVTVSIFCKQTVDFPDKWHTIEMTPFYWQFFAPHPAEFMVSVSLEWLRTAVIDAYQDIQPRHAPVRRKSNEQGINVNFDKSLVYCPL
jgi:hypothetical protein